MADPAEMQGMSGNPFYNPLSPDPDWVRGVQAIYALMQQAKDKKKAEKEAADEKFWKDYERQLGMKKTRAEIKETEANTEKLLHPPTEPKTKGYTLPKATLSDVAKYHGLNNESEYGEFPPQMQERMVNEYLDAQTSARTAGLKKTPTKAGMSKLNIINEAIKSLRDRASDYSKMLNATIINPMSDPDGSLREGAKKALGNLRRVQMWMSTLPSKMDENGVLPEPYEARFSEYLNMPDAVETGRMWEPMAPKTEAEKKLPPGFTIQK